MSLSVIYSFSILKYNTSTLITISASYSVFDASKYNINRVYLDSWLIIFKIELYTTPISSSFDFSNLVIKSIITVY